MTTIKPMSAFASQPSDNKADTFAGSLRLINIPPSSHHKIIKDTYQLHNASRVQLPKFEFDFIQDGKHLIPLKRGIITNDHPSWEYILEPGRVWKEEGDQGFSRASLPFTLIEKNENCMHNGVLSFLYKDDGNTSNAAYQISSETCLYYQVDLWGTLKAQYTPKNFTQAGDIRKQYQDERANRIPTKPISDLQHDYPGANHVDFSNDRFVSKDKMSSYGVFIDGTHYVSDCQTRQGPYPFCDVMTLPSYSTAKTNFAAVALLHLQQKTGDAFSQKIADYVPSCAENSHWQDVTFENTLDMATGNYGDPKPMADEAADHTTKLFEATDHADKIHYACNHYPRRSTPGQNWAYHTSDTYILGAAMEAFSQQHFQQSLFDDIVIKDLWQPLKLSQSVLSTRRTMDETQQPFTGWGLAYHRDDAVKLGRFLQQGGAIEGKQMLDAKELAAALQQNPENHGLNTGMNKMDSHAESFRYNNGFWAYKLTAIKECGDLWIPFMSGYGGIIMALLPNDSLYYYFSDSGVHRWQQAAIASHKLKSFCPT